MAIGTTIPFFVSYSGVFELNLRTRTRERLVLGPSGDYNQGLDAG